MAITSVGQVRFEPDQFFADQTCAWALWTHNVLHIKVVNQASSEKLAITGQTSFLYLQKFMFHQDFAFSSVNVTNQTSIMKHKVCHPEWRIWITPVDKCVHVPEWSVISGTNIDFCWVLCQFHEFWCIGTLEKSLLNPLGKSCIAIAVGCRA